MVSVTARCVYILYSIHYYTFQKGMTLEDGTSMDECKCLNIHEVDDSIHTERGHLCVLGERNHFKDLPCTCQVPEGIVVDASRVNHNMEEEEVPQFEETI